MTESQKLATLALMEELTFMMLCRCFPSVLPQTVSFRCNAVCNLSKRREAQ